MNICAEPVFKKVYEKCQKPLQHFLLARGVVLDAVADQVQECFVRLWKNCDKVTEEKSLSYLFTTASRLQIDVFRKNKTRLQFRNQQTEALVDKKDGQYELEGKEFKARFEEVLDKMKPKSREVFFMNRFDNMTYKQIAETLDISVKAVEKRMSIALKHLLQHKINLKK